MTDAPIRCNGRLDGAKHLLNIAQERVTTTFPMDVIRTFVGLSPLHRMAGVSPRDINNISEYQPDYSLNHQSQSGCEKPKNP